MVLIQTQVEVYFYLLKIWGFHGDEHSSRVLLDCNAIRIQKTATWKFYAEMATTCLTTLYENVWKHWRN